MIKFEKIKPGMKLYDVRKATGCGAARGQKWDTWRVDVHEVDTENRRVFASWNWNRPEWMPESRITKYRANKPKP